MINFLADMPPDVAMQTEGYEMAFFKMIVTLGGLLALLFLTIYVLKRIAQGRVNTLNQGKNIKILEKRPLSAKSILYVVEVEGQRILLSESQLEVRRITEIEDTEE